MRKVFADTSFLVAYYNKSDENHHAARDFHRNEDDILYVITDYIFDEFLTVLLAMELYRLHILCVDEKPFY